VILSELQVAVHKTQVRYLEFVCILALGLPQYVVFVLFLFFNTLLK